jgi:cytochrome c-type biogenesis protein CcmH/NrfF
MRFSGCSLLWLLPVLLILSTAVQVVAQNKEQPSEVKPCR